VKGGSMIGVNRRRVMGGKSLPYDAEIEYLESTGTQWIDTGIYPTNTTVAKLKFMNLSYTGDVIFGMYDSQKNSYRLFNYSKDAYFDTGDGVNVGRLITTDIKIQINTIYEIELGNKYIKDIIADTIIYGTTYNATYNKTLTLNNYNNRNFSENRWYHVEIFDDTTLILDLIPVRIGTTGYMYDKVSGELFSNDGTGDFILGPDKN